MHLCPFSGRSHLGPLRSWMAKVLPSLDESEPVHGDVETVQILTDVHAVCAWSILSLLESSILCVRYYTA